ncbi:hypothetical protein BS50DRAFT_574490 [Corynespora cassiicola Philippines]|uniref:Uncharacterized protein n=1 Tax=Corynespora cassiicola Philippines TaxID=1448308 RepID=A0A2T2NKQ3_CORCC|nr:hypothetical protein BS50DRAFT_574490 [Corynespora cassiicola Philippines]
MRWACRELYQGIVWQPTHASERHSTSDPRQPVGPFCAKPSGRCMMFRRIGRGDVRRRLCKCIDRQSPTAEAGWHWLALVGTGWHWLAASPHADCQISDVSHDVCE